MKASRQRENADTAPQTASDLYANFLAIEEQFQALEAENADWNLKKARLKKPRRWSSKRLLVPPAAKTKAVRPSGAQQGNTNRLTHGKYTRESQLILSLVRTHIRAGRALGAAMAP